MEPTSSPDNARQSRGLARFWPVHRDGEDEPAEDATPAETVARPGDTEMVALGSRRASDEPGAPVAETPADADPVASADPGPATPGDPPGRPASDRAPSQPSPSGSPHPPALSGSPSPAGLSSLGGPGSSPSGPASSLGGPGSPGGPGSSPVSSEGPASSADGDAAPSGPEAPAGQHGTPDRDPDHSGAPEASGDPAAPVESTRNTPWDRDPGTFGGFGLGGRNGRFLFGGRGPAEQRPGVNGNGAAELNGRPGTAATGASEAAGRVRADSDTAGQADRGDENGRDDMNGRAGIPGYPATGEAGPAGAGGDAARRDPGDGPGTEPRRQAAGWASVPTSSNPVVSPISAAPISAAPISGAPASGGPALGGPASGAPSLDGPASGAPSLDGPASGTSSLDGPASGAPSLDGPASGAPASGPPAPAAPTSGGPAAPASPGGVFGRPPAYLPGLPDPVAGPVSGVPAPRGAAGVPAPAAPAGRFETFEDTRPVSAAGQVSLSFGTDAPEAPPAGPGRLWADDSVSHAPLPRRSASLEDAEPARRAHRAAEEEASPTIGEGPHRPGDVAAGNIAFWDDDATRHFRAAWHEVKAEFVDDPVNALTRAHDLLTDAVNELTEAMLAERDELDPLRGDGTPDTESMRMAMRGYREFLDRILAL